MGDYSRSPLQLLLANRAKGYVGLHIEQGVPVLDRDLNLLNDLISATVREVISRYIGDGMAVGREGFAIEVSPADNDFTIRAGAAGPGTALVGGIEVNIAADMNYTAQPSLPVLTTPNAMQPDPRVDIVYLDVSLREIEGNDDADLLNVADVGIQTSVRQLPTWVVRVAEGVPIPAAPAGHVHCPLAELTRPRNNPQISETMIEDLRKPMSPLTEVERRLRKLETLLFLPAFSAPGSQFSPQFGGTDTVVTLTGINFTVGGAPQVRFDSALATFDGTPTATEIKVRVPGGLALGEHPITVITAAGQVTSTDRFTILPPPRPILAAPGSQFSPQFGGINTIVTLTGNNFNAGGTPQVRFGSVSAALEGVPTATQILVRVPAGLGAGAVKITVETSGGTVVSDDIFTRI